MRKSTVLLIMAGVMTLFTLSGCAVKGQPTGIPEQENATQVKEDTTFYSTYLGLELTVPKDWWLVERDPLNLKDNNKEEDAVLLNEMGDETYSHIPLATYSNLQYSSEIGHLTVSVSAEKLTGVWGLASFNQTQLDDMLSRNEDITPELILSQEIDINGKTFMQNIVQFTGAQDPFEIMTLVTEAKKGYFITFYNTYWLDMYDDARVVAEDMAKTYAKFTESTAE